MTARDKRVCRRRPIYICYDLNGHILVVMTRDGCFEQNHYAFRGENTITAYEDIIRKYYSPILVFSRYIQGIIFKYREILLQYRIHNATILLLQACICCKTWLWVI